MGTINLEGFTGPLKDWIETENVKREITDKLNNPFKNTFNFAL